MLRFNRLFLKMVLGSFSILLSGLISCNSPQFVKPVLKFWTMQLQPEFTPYFTRLISDFEKHHPNVRISWVDIPWDAMESKILSSVASNTAPDVVNLNPNFASLLAGRGAWLNLNYNLSSAEIDQYLPKVWQANSLDKIAFGFPWYLTTEIIFYNQEILHQAGLSTPPVNYQQLAHAARLIKEKTGKYAFFVTFLSGDSAQALESLVQMNVKLFDEKGRAAFNSPEGIAAFKYWVDLYKEGLLPPEVLTQGHREAIDLYQSGQLALLSAGSEFFKSILTNAPNIAKVTKFASQITGKSGKRGVDVMNLVIPRDSHQVDLATEFALYITNTQNQLEFAKAASVLPSTVDGIDIYLKELSINDVNNDRLLQARAISAKQLKEAQVLIEPRKNLNQLQKIIYDNLQASMLGDKSVETALKDAAEQWNALL